MNIFSVILIPVASPGKAIAVSQSMSVYMQNGFMKGPDGVPFCITFNGESAVLSLGGSRV